MSFENNIKTLNKTLNMNNNYEKEKKAFVLICDYRPSFSLRYVAESVFINPIGFHLVDFRKIFL